MAERPFNIDRAPIRSRLAELKRRLDVPTPENVQLVRDELDRLARG